MGEGWKKLKCGKVEIGNPKQAKGEMRKESRGEVRYARGLTA
jgi:hypothetical protein